MKERFRALLSLFASIALVTAGTFSVAHAGMIDSAAVMQMEQRDASIAQIEQLLERDRLASQMETMGVDAADVAERLDQLTDEELLLLQDRLEALPAGAGILEVIGVIFVVLLILELVGVTNIFTAI